MAEDHKEIDAVTGTATTGHEWDGMRELNTPLPRWWLWLFYVTIVWSIGYWIVYPAWPLLTASTQGVFGWHSRSAVVDDLAELKATARSDDGQARRGVAAEIVADPQLLDFARAQGRVAFAENCAPCHGAGGGGAKGYPNLNDDDWLWGGKLADIEQTIRHGARAGDDKGRHGQHAGVRPRRHAEAERDLGGRRLRALARRPAGRAGADLAARQEGLRRQLRASVTAPTGKGNRELGAPNLTDAIWLYGSDKQTIVDGMRNGRGGVMPAWAGRLTSNHQGADRLRPYVRRRREMTAAR